MVMRRWSSSEVAVYGVRSSDIAAVEGVCLRRTDELAAGEVEGYLSRAPSTQDLIADDANLQPHLLRSDNRSSSAAEVQSSQ